MLVRREQTPVALLTVHSLKGRRALPFYDLQNGWVPRRGRVTTARHSCPDVPIFGLPCFYFSIKHSIPHFFKRSGSQELPCKKYTILVPNSKEIIYFFKTFPDLRVFSKNVSGSDDVADLVIRLSIAYLGKHSSFAFSRAVTRSGAAVPKIQQFES